MINLDFLRLRVCFSEVYEPEEDSGASPGMDGFPVFETDMGTVGMITCYESWFSDTNTLSGSSRSVERIWCCSQARVTFLRS